LPKLRLHPRSIRRGLWSLGSLFKAFTLARGKALSHSVETKTLSILGRTRFSWLLVQVYCLLHRSNSISPHWLVQSLKASDHMWLIIPLLLSLANLIQD
jgi:hypothetical protein